MKVVVRQKAELKDRNRSGIPECRPWIHHVFGLGHCGEGKSGGIVQHLSRSHRSCTPKALSRLRREWLKDRQLNHVKLT